MKEQAGKGAILMAAIGCVSKGLSFLENGQIEYGIALIIIGFGLAIAYVYLIEKQTVKKAVNKIMEMKKWKKKKSKK